MKKILFFSIAALLLASCGGGGRPSRDNGGGNEPDDTAKVVASIPVKPTVNVYIENSGSMDGYVKGINEFKDAIGKLLADLKHYYDEENVKIFFINNDDKEKLRVKETAIDINIADFATYIDINWKKEKRGNNTNLNNIFREILAKTDSNTISILFSDCIYSIGNGSTVNLLNYEKNTTYDAFLSKSKDNNGDLATTIVKMKSKFDGNYYPYIGDSHKFYYKGELPYYICIIANQIVLADFNRNIKFEKGEIEGFDNKYIIAKGAANNLYYSVLLSTDNVGRFKATRALSTPRYIHGIEDVNMKARSRDGSGSNKLTFAVAVDLSNIPVENDYLFEVTNYTLGDNNFIVKEIKTIDKNRINASDWVRICEKKPTHLIVLEATGTATSNVKIALKKQMPQWIENSSIIDDTSINKLKDGKTFGLKYWVEGIAEAYQKIYPDDKNYFELEIKIKK